jgi:hypothetical protein
VAIPSPKDGLVRDLDGRFPVGPVEDHPPGDSKRLEVRTGSRALCLFSPVFDDSTRLLKARPAPPTRTVRATPTKRKQVRNPPSQGSRPRAPAPVRPGRGARTGGIKGKARDRGWLEWWWWWWTVAHLVHRAPRPISARRWRRRGGALSTPHFSISNVLVRAEPHHGRPAIYNGIQLPAQRGEDGMSSVVSLSLSLLSSLCSQITRTTKRRRRCDTPAWPRVLGLLAHPSTMITKSRTFTRHD